ncbi:GNAT family N-acetyltransferase [Photobacterium lipolyticum]|uniref:N-acetyltransferase n=1 Tax=Photobacterium lipolyticum TaxID=266810 RepID=A0A2T3N1N1_9GAMM|nr:GNAT family N-acetyltransferase [Photobacterium lipolyticum]PSW06203.1 N-acetyltransferase [Photobacterium lipolyticum]
MNQYRYHVMQHDGMGVELVDTYKMWAEAVLSAVSLTVEASSSGSSRRIARDKRYIIDTEAKEGDEDVFIIDETKKVFSTGHRRRAYLDRLSLLPIATLAMSQLAECIASLNTITVLSSLLKSTSALKELMHGNEELPSSDDLSALPSPLTRYLDPDSDVCLVVYHREHVIAMASFSRYIEDHRFALSCDELCYELSLHTVFVHSQYRGLGIASSLTDTIINIVRKDMKHLHQALSEGGIQLSPWFSAVALTPGGEVICDKISEAFVEVNEDIVGELADEGVHIDYQEPVICVESVAN